VGGIVSREVVKGRFDPRREIVERMRWEGIEELECIGVKRRNMIDEDSMCREVMDCE